MPHLDFSLAVRRRAMWKGIFDDFHCHVYIGRQPTDETLTSPVFVVSVYFHKRHYTAVFLACNRM